MNVCDKIKQRGVTAYMYHTLTYQFPDCDAAHLKPTVPSPVCSRQT